MLSVVEVYLRRAKENLQKKKSLECNRNLDLEALIAKDSWETIEELEEVISYHMRRFKTVIEKCTDSTEARFPSKGILFSVSDLLRLFYS